MKNTLYKLQNPNGVEVKFLAKGGKLISILIPGKNKKTDILLGYETPEQYDTGDVYLGALCGRVANRINNGKCTIDGKTYQLNCNDGKNTLHGGTNGFWNKDWQVEQISDQQSLLSLTSKDNDQGFPGNLNVNVLYTLTDNNILEIDIKAISDKNTIVNITSHPYFNLMGPGKSNAWEHRLQVNAKQYTEIDPNGIPTGLLPSVENTPFDFRESQSIGKLKNSNYPQSQLVDGIDHNFVVNKKDRHIGFAASLSHPETQRRIDVHSTQPGIQVYLGSHFNGSTLGKKGCPINKHNAIALEAQKFPDSINQKDFPSTLLKAGELYHEVIQYRFFW